MELEGHSMYSVVNEGDTIYMTSIDEAVIQPRKRSAAARDLRQYRRLIYNVKKVYPYAKLAGQKFGEVTAHLQTLNTGKEQREYIRQLEKDLLHQYEEDLKDLTITQGRILIKLIDRETNQTSYEIVKELRGSFQAAFWQAIARIFGSNLKTEFDADGEDKVLNEIMIMIENGQL
jgi:pyruvate dehydrogenase complex dehydrogenase (E1) component